VHLSNLRTSASILAKVRPSQRSEVFASYVWLISASAIRLLCYEQSAPAATGPRSRPAVRWLGRQQPCMPGFKAPDLYASTEPGGCRERKRLLDRRSPRERQQRGNRVTKEWQDLQQRDVRLKTGTGGGKQALDRDREPPTVRDRYGRPSLGKNMCWRVGSSSREVGFVNVNGWKGQGASVGAEPQLEWDMQGGHMGMGKRPSGFGSLGYWAGIATPR